MQEPVILSAARTPVGRFGGTLKALTDQDLGVLVIKEAVKRAGIDPAQVDEVCLAQQYRTGALPPNVARPIAVNAGIPIPTPEYTVSHACGGSLKTVFLAAQAVKAGDAELMVAGGVEHMSNAAYLVPSNRWGSRLGHAKMIDQLVLFDPLSNNTMGETAENVAEQFQINREDQDAFALNSQQKTKRALELGLFKDEVVQVPIPRRKGDPVIFDTDEHPRPQTTAEDLAKLKPVFRKGGSVTAGNSSGMNDGASAVVVASRQRADELGVKPLVAILGYATVGVEPSIMGIGPIEATRQALKKSGLSLGDIDLIELNEAFASQSLACIRELGMDQDKVNVNGGAIALGHPISATGGVILTKLIYEMKRSGKELGLATMCVGGGMGVALVVKNLT
ncbi:MAG: acetyl-CoA C-acetyltransferase [Desulfarculus sp.]|nr:acetyl-CoA C-acetyltransferase [Pseudomonadota bacterium]MBU4572991.1 acetyl-CoA C-acetyltransferase [Pseudomonadota bacterium]MBU4598582.1 acetyl-CoA C-acetyltransferase [Pseudomonadota bacterium]MBV1716433.1 acetyl-CoA C-acetyltransferase [Desulfarculus sp.]MBV1736917.1 acetyl-CoA C-acetyltransferase [Desulfarculus sp.]